MNNPYPEYLKSRILILGCGNPLFGDDGFGPAVIEHIQNNYDIPEDTYLLDAGTNTKDTLLSIALSEVKPEKIILIDSLDLRREPGTLIELPIENLPEDQTGYFSLHHFPTRNLLTELQDLHKVNINIIACQVERIPQQVEVGLSKPVKKAIPKVAKIILEKINPQKPPAPPSTRPKR
jgi:coenzyme F420 hydrogenase subunit delta